MTVKKARNLIRRRHQDLRELIIKTIREVAIAVGTRALELHQRWHLDIPLHAGDRRWRAWVRIADVGPTGYAVLDRFVGGGMGHAWNDLQTTTPEQCQDLTTAQLDAILNTLAELLERM